MGAVDPSLESVYEFLQETTRASYQRTYIELLFLSDKTNQLLHEVEEEQIVLSKELQEPDPLDLSELGMLQMKLDSVLTNSNAHKFVFEQLGSYTVPFYYFYEQFTRVLIQSGVEPSAGLRRVIRDELDTNRNSVVDAEEINHFFNIWDNPEARQQIISRATGIREKKRINSVQYKLLLIVISSIPNPQTSAKSLNVGDQYELTFEGYPQSKHFCADGITNFGRESKQFKNDVEFHPADTRIKNAHFQILSKKTGYYLVDLGTPEGIYIRLTDFPLILLEDAVIRFGDNKCRVVRCRVETLEVEEGVDTPQYHRLNVNPLGPTQIHLQFLSGRLQGRQFTFGKEKRAITIGSMQSSDIVLDEHLNMRHAIIELRDSGWVLTDLASMAGTWYAVNTYTNTISNKASNALKLMNNITLSIPGVEFKVIYKGDEDIKFSLKDYSGDYRQGLCIEKHEFVKHIRTGTFGDVYMVQNKLTGQNYAWKRIYLNKLNDQGVFELLKLRYLDHPNIVKIYEIQKNDSYIGLIAELCEGGELFERIQARQTLTEQMASRIMRQVLSALSYMHSLDIIHRDIKPENILFANDSEDSDIKVIDFGSASELNSLDNQIVGSAYYIAPEVFKHKYNTKCDIWSAGVMLYIMICGRPPFNGKKDEIIAKIRSGKIGFRERAWDRVSKYCRRVVARMLTYDPDKRPSAQELLKDPWIRGSIRYIDFNQPIAVRAFKNLKQFHATTKLQQALFYFIANIIKKPEEIDQIAKLFLAADSDGSGKLTRDELKNVLQDNPTGISDQELDRIISEVDIDQSGSIDYSEFITAVTDRKKLLDRELLEQTFAQFDADGSGDITADELRNILGHSIAEWQQLIDQVDQNKDGKIDLKEFKNMMVAFAGV